MNLKEEIKKHRRTWDGNGESLHLIEEKDAEKIAESYAKEKAWEAWWVSACKTVTFQAKDKEYERRCFEKWWEDNK